MQPINDDMDELFRRAGEDYPLDTSSADWEQVAKKMNLSVEEKNESKSSNRKLLWLLLLLPFSFICTHYFINKQDNTIGAANTEKNNSGQPTTARQAAEKESQNQGSQNQINGEEKQLFNTNRNKSNDVAIPVLQTAKPAIKNQDKKTAESHQQGYNIVATKSSEVNSSEKAGEMAAPTFREQLDAVTKMYPSLSATAKAQHKDIVTIAGTKKVQPPKPHNKKFYAGLMGGVDATAVKFQKIENAGYDFGLLFGYSFNKKWSVESGVFLDKKFYYSKGEYFNTSKIYLPPNSEISSVTGDCKMWEIPLSVRYNFKSSAKHTWFGTAGVSSYLMKKEDYDYVYYYPMTGQSYNRYRSYDNASKHLFSVAQISVGYSHQLGKIADLRVEPYFKIPLRGVGVGSMPLQSAGVHIGITKKLF